MISQLALFFFLLLFCATNGLSRGLQVRGSKEVLGRHLHIGLGFVKLRIVVSLDFENGTAEIIRLADLDTMKTNRFANKAIAYLLNCENEKLPKETMVAFEP